MPTVPTYQDTQQHVALRPEYTEGLAASADADAFGAAIGLGIQNAATGLGTLADAVAKVEQLDNANAAKDRQTKFGDWSREALHGNGGFLTLTGRTGVEGRATFEKLAEQKHAEFGKGLMPGAARAYDEAAIKAPAVTAANRAICPVTRQDRLAVRRGLARSGRQPS